MQPKKGATIGILEAKCQYTCQFAEDVRENSPEVVVASAPYFMAITEEVRHQSWAEITSQVDSITGLPTEASTNTEDDEEETERCQWTSSNVSLVLECVDHEHEKPTCDEFVEEHAGACHELGRVCAENAGGSGVTEAGDCADAGAALVDIDGGFVVGVYNTGGTHGAENLGESVDGEFSPWEFAENAVGECDCRVQMGTGNTGGVDTQHNTETIQHVSTTKPMGCIWKTHPQPQFIDWKSPFLPSDRTT